MSVFCDVIVLSQLFEIAPLSQELQASNSSHNPQNLLTETLRQEGRWRVHTISDILEDGWLLCSKELVGDAPGLYHPLYVFACLTSFHVVDEAIPLPDWPLPRVSFTTEENVLRSMTLNGMRMGTEYFASNSLRVLDLVENRLQLGQRDVIHNVLVYIARQILDARAEELETRNLRAESVAAYLGLEQNAVQNLFHDRELDVENLSQNIESGIAGSTRRALDIRALLQGQLSLLQSELETPRQTEARWLWLLDEVAMRMYVKGAV